MADIMELSMTVDMAVGKFLLCLIYFILLYAIAKYENKKKKIPDVYNFTGHLIVLISYFFGNEYVSVAYLSFIVCYIFMVLSKKTIKWDYVLLLPHFASMMVFLNPAIATVLFAMMVVYSLLKNKEMETIGKHLLIVYAIGLILYLLLLPGLLGFIF